MNYDLDILKAKALRDVLEHKDIDNILEIPDIANTLQDWFEDEIIEAIYDNYGVEYEWINDHSSGEYIQISEDGMSAMTVYNRTVVVEIIPDENSNPDNFHDLLFHAIRDYFRTNNVSYNIWSVNDHGNVTLYDPNGNAIGGLV